MKKTFKSVICLATLAWFAGTVQIYAQQNDSEEFHRHIRYAKTAFDRGEYPNALKEYKEALILSPAYPELYKAIGQVHEKLAAAADLKAAIAHYRRYLELAPDATDARQIKNKIYDLEYVVAEKVKQDSILDDLNGEWVAVDNLNISKIEKDGTIRYSSDFIFQIDEIQKTRTYRVTMIPKGNRYYNDNLIEKTVNITAKGSAITFIFADATTYTPKSGKYDIARGAGNAAGSSLKSEWVSILTNAIIDTWQESDLPSNTQTSYNFALQYKEGKLVGLVNIVTKYADPTRQQTTENKLHEITFVKNDNRFYDVLASIFEAQPDIISDLKVSTVTSYSTKFKDKWGKRLSRKEIASKLYSLDPQLGKEYYKAHSTETAAMVTYIVSLSTSLSGGLIWGTGGKNQQLKTTGRIMTFGALAITIASIGIGAPAASKKIRLINQYNKQILQQHKPITEFRFGITPSGGFGLTFNF
jgi:tetratricopeptide (TPR) repeat protein